MQKIEPVKNLILKELHGHFRNSYVLKDFVIRTREEQFLPMPSCDVLRHLFSL